MIFRADRKAGPNRRCHLLPDEFIETGLAVWPGAMPATRFQVLGERSSGTNLATRLIRRNTALVACDDLGWKHGFPSTTAIAPDIAVIGLVRSAADWALSMHAKPWHTTPEMQALGFSDFIRAPWDTVIDRPRYFGGKTGITGEVLQQDRVPLSGARFANLFALRRAKLAGLLSYPARGCTCALLRLETLTAAPEDTINALAAKLGLPIRDTPFHPVTKRLGSRFKPARPDRPATPESIEAADMAFLRGQIDRAQEAALGYEYRQERWRG